MLLNTLVALELLTAGDPVTPAAQRRAAQELSEAGANEQAADAWLVLANMDPSQRMEALDQAHANLSAAFHFQKDPRMLCRALNIAETLLDDNTFASDAQALYWRDHKIFDEKDLEAHAKKTQRSNCRFDATGRPRVRVAMLPDTPLPEPPKPEAPPPTRSTATMPTPAPVLVVPTLDTRQHRRRTHRIAGAVLASVGAGLTGGMIGALATMEKHHGVLRSQLAEQSDGQRFSAAQFADTQATIRRATEVRGLAIGLGVGAAISVTTAIIVWATGKDRRDTRTSRVNFTGTTLQF